MARPKSLIPPERPAKLGLQAAPGFQRVDCYLGAGFVDVALHEVAERLRLGVKMCAHRWRGEAYLPAALNFSVGSSAFEHCQLHFERIVEAQHAPQWLGIEFFLLGRVPQQIGRSFDVQSSFLFIQS
jgi:hypothetical protein